jgi:DNA-binding LacI/PurR family transcriptional regulator
MGTQPYYKQIYDYLLGEISSGKLKEGDRAPSERELCRQFSVSQITSKRALELLAGQGLLVRYPGKGSFVTGKMPERTLVSGGSNLIGLIISDFGDTFGVRLICSIEETAAALGYHIILKRTRDILSREGEAISSLLARDVAGFLMVPTYGEYYHSEILRLILDKKPLIFFDRKMEGLAVPMVATENVKAAETGVEYLFELGHRKIAFFSRPLERTTSLVDRKQGFINAFKKRKIALDPASFLQGFSPNGIDTYTKTARDDIKLISGYLSSHPEITAVFATEYPFAMATKYAAEKAGWRLPRDLSIVCCGDPPLSFAKPAFTYLRQNEEAMGKIAMETLHRIINGEDPSLVKDTSIPAKLVIGLSTAPNKKD